MQQMENKRNHLFLLKNISLNNKRSINTGNYYTKQLRDSFSIQIHNHLSGEHLQGENDLHISFLCTPLAPGTLLSGASRSEEGERVFSHSFNHIKTALSEPQVVKKVSEVERYCAAPGSVSGMCGFIFMRKVK